MESPTKSLPGTIPFEILDEFFGLIAEEEDLKVTSLVCPRWRYLSQHELFAVVQVDPMPIGTHGICQVATPLHAHLATYIKEVRVVNLSGTTAPRDPKHAFQCSPQFMDFLRSLPVLQTMDFRHPHFDWAEIPKDTVNVFLRVFSRPPFRALEVSGGRNFPVLLFLDRTNVDTPVMMDTKYFAFLPHVERANLLETRLTNLSLLDPDTIKAFLAFLRTQPMVVPAFCRNLTRLTLKYVECCLFSSFRSDTVTEILDTIGASVELLKVEVSWPFAEPPEPLSLRALMNLRHLHLSFTFPIPRRQDAFFTDNILPVITSLPMPQNLVSASVALGYYIQGFPMISGCDQPFKILESQIELAFMDAKWTGLRRVHASLQLLGGANAPIQTMPMENPLPGLKSQGVCVGAFVGA